MGDFPAPVSPQNSGFTVKFHRWENVPRSPPPPSVTFVSQQALRWGLLLQKFRFWWSSAELHHPTSHVVPHDAAAHLADPSARPGGAIIGQTDLGVIEPGDSPMTHKRQICPREIFWVDQARAQDIDAGRAKIDQPLCFSDVVCSDFASVLGQRGSDSAS